MPRWLGGFNDDRRTMERGPESFDHAIRGAERIAKRNPTRYTMTAGPTKRIGKLFIDHLRNGRGFTAIGTYSPRARAGLPVAMPTTWKILEQRAQPKYTTLGK